MRNHKLLDDAERLVLAGKREEALPALLKLAKMNFEKDRCLMLLGSCLLGSDPRRAAELFAMVPGHSPLHPVALLDRGIAESLAGLPDGIGTLERALRIMPHAPAGRREGRMLYSWSMEAARLALATALQKEGRDGEAIPYLERCGGPRSRLDLAYCRMREGIFDVRSWELHESRLGLLPGYLDPPKTEGSPDGKTVMVYAEQGMGDNIQFARYLGPLRERAGKTILVTREPLKEIFADLADEVVAEGEPHSPYDMRLPVMSLPHLLGLGREMWRGPYLKPSKKKADEWRERLPPGRKVGIVWKGGRRTSGDEVERKMRRRDLPKDPLLDAIPDGFVKISLQLPTETAPGTHDPTGGIRDYHDTAAIISHLELVVSPDTSVAHLAAAMGRTTLMPSRKDACWRWGKSTETTPWYPSMRIFRQEEKDDWTVPLRNLRAELEVLLEDPARLG